MKMRLGEKITRRGYNLLCMCTCGGKSCLLRDRKKGCGSSKSSHRKMGDQIYMAEDTDASSLPATVFRNSQNDYTIEPLVFTTNGDSAEGRIQSVDELLLSTEELLRYTRGSGRRSCIISRLNLGPEDHKELNDSNKRNKSMLKHRSQSYNGKLNHSLSKEEDTTNGTSGQTNGDSQSIETSPDVLPGRDYQNNVLSSDKSKSLTRSIIKLLPSRKKTFSSDSLEYFLKYKLKASEFHDERLLGFRHSHWRDLVALQDGETLANIYTAREIKRLDVVWELFQNECVFLIEQLMVLKHVFMEPLKNCQVEDHLMLVEPYKLFGNLDELCHISYAFCRDFMNTLDDITPGEFGSTEILVGCLDSMTLNSQHGQVYHSYLLNYKKALTYLASLRDEIEDMGVFEKFCERDRRCNRLKLADLLVAPMHHWTRLPLVLTRIRDYTDDQDEVEKLDECIDNVKMSLESLENKMGWLKTFERVKEIDKQLIWPSVIEATTCKPFIPDSLKSILVNSPRANREVLADQVRELLYEGQLLLTELDKVTDIHAFLFTDILLLSKVKKDPKKSRINRMSNPDKRRECFYNVIGQPLSIETLTVYDVTDTDAGYVNMCNTFVVVQRNKYQQISSILTLQSRTSLGKENWMSWIRKANSQLIKCQGHGEPRRQESFKQLLHLEESSPTSLLKMSRVLELTSSPSRTRPVSKHSQLRKLNSSVELRTFPRANSSNNKPDDFDEQILTVQPRTRAMSVDSFGYENKSYTLESHKQLTMEERTASSPRQLTIEESTASDEDGDDSSADNDVVFEL